MTPYANNDNAADVFTSGDSSDKVATDWYHRYRADDTAAVTDLVNCILLAAGCDQQVTQDDIRDPENCSNRLADLQNVYTEVRWPKYRAWHHVALRLTRVVYRRASLSIRSFRRAGQPSPSATCLSASSGPW